MSSEIQKLFLYPAALYAGKEPTNVITILGSCVAVCLWDPVEKRGGINHFMLPLWNGQGLASPRYGNIAVKRLIEEMEVLGSNRANLQAKVFGGAEVIEMKYSNFKIGQRNIDLAFKQLKQENVEIKAKSTGGKQGRKILFHTGTGEVRMKFIKNTGFDKK
ncbi:MAG: chemotaxis protein CheD [Bacteroidota bacterium]|nr:chemotaxis protein CheD [Bacteroidota bacterium]